MYTQFFELTCKPFGVSPDPRFLYCDSRLKQTLAAMSSRFQYPGGVIVLTGEVGAGKTTVLNHLARQFPLLCYNKPVLSINDVFRNICDRLGMSKGFSDIYALSCQLSEYQNRSPIERRYEIFAFDEAHDYPDQVLLDLLRLQDAVTENDGRFTIVLAGDEGLVDKITRLDLEKKRGNISYYTVENLDLKSVTAMVDHRLNIAGSGVQKVYSPSALEEIYKFSKGIPRLVNNICELSLITSFNRKEKIVTTGSIRMAARTLVNPDSSTSSCNQQINKGPGQSKKTVPGQAPGDDRLPADKILFAKVEWACSILIALLFLGLTYQPFRAKVLQEIVVDSDAGYHGTAVDNPDQNNRLSQLGHVLALGAIPATVSTDKPDTPIIPICQDCMDTTTRSPDVVTENRGPEKSPEAESVPDTAAQSKALATLSAFHEKNLPATFQESQPVTPTGEENIHEIARKPESLIPLQSTKKNAVLATKKTGRRSVKAEMLRKRPGFTAPVSAQAPQALRLETNLELAKAIKDNDTALVRQLLIRGNDPNSTNEKRLPLLMEACQRGYLEVAKLLLEKGASTEVKDRLGETALMKSVWNGSKKTVLLLIEHGADVNQRNTDGCSSLLFAGITGRYEIAEILLDHGANPDLADNDGKTPLMAAAWNEHIGIVKLLLEKRVDLNRMDKNHWTALMFAGFQGHEKIFDLLTTAGANPYLKNSEGSNAVDLALSQRHGDFSRYALN